VKPTSGTGNSHAAPYASIPMLGGIAISSYTGGRGISPVHNISAPHSRHVHDLTSSGAFGASASSSGSLGGNASTGAGGGGETPNNLRACASCFFRTEFARLTASPEDAAEKRMDLPLCDGEDCAGRTGVGDVGRVFQQRPAGCARQTGVAILNPRPGTGAPETDCLRLRRRRSPGGHSASTRPFPSARPAVSSGG